MNLPETATDLPWSARMCYRALDNHGPMAQKNLCAELSMPRSTAHDALETLEDHGLIHSEQSSHDGRQTIYRVR